MLEDTEWAWEATESFVRPQNTEPSIIDATNGTNYINKMTMLLNCPECTKQNTVCPTTFLTIKDKYVCTGCFRTNFYFYTTAIPVVKYWSAS